MTAEAIIRRANRDDLPGIHAVKIKTWPDEESDTGLILEVLDSPEHITIVAEHTGQIVGFVDGFVTYSETACRWEVDLLAVDPTFRGSRLGERLVRSSCTAGYGQGADYCRALIQVSNIASQKTFQRCGFFPEQRLNRLYVANAFSGSDEKAVPASFILRVNTMNYRGVWLESQFAKKDLMAARAFLSEEGIQIAGAVIPIDWKESCNAAEALGFQLIGIYQYWQDQLKGGFYCC